MCVDSRRRGLSLCATPTAQLGTGQRGRHPLLGGGNGRGPLSRGPEGARRGDRRSERTGAGGEDRPPTLAHPRTNLTPSPVTLLQNMCFLSPSRSVLLGHRLRLPAGKGILVPGTQPGSPGRAATSTWTTSCPWTGRQGPLSLRVVSEHSCAPATRRGLRGPRPGRRGPLEVPGVGGGGSTQEQWSRGQAAASRLQR